MILELSHENQQKSIKLQQFPVIIGQGKDGDVVSLDDSSIGHYQCMIDRHSDGFIVWDLGTRLGTIINGIPIKENTLLLQGDQLMIGEHRFTVEVRI